MQEQNHRVCSQCGAVRIREARPLSWLLSRMRLTTAPHAGLLPGHSVAPDTLWPRGLQPISLLCPWDFPIKNTRVGCHFLFQGIFPTQGLNSHSLCPMLWQEDSLPLSHLGVQHFDKDGMGRKENSTKA